jgi:chemotaxis protein MotB
MTEVRDQLAAALAARLRAEQTATDLLTAAEQRQALLQAAQGALSDEEETSFAAQRQTELLNQQVAALRAQLGGLQVLLDGAVASDAAKEVQLQSLGSNLNNALARVAAEERRNRLLEEEKRKALEAETQDLEKYRSEFFGRLRDVLGNQEGVRIEGDRFVFSSEVLFPPGGADLSRAGEGEIAKVATILRSIAGDIPPEINWVIRVDGHTDNIPLSGQGEFADNWELSQARALSVVKYMVSFLAIPPDRLAANGFGQYQPVNTDNTEGARAQNRRIELKFTEK